VHAFRDLAGIRFGIETKVHVAIDESGEQGGVVEAELPAAVALELVHGCYPANALALDENPVLREGAAYTIDNA
jgi:hypothetical protein